LFWRSVRIARMVLVHRELPLRALQLDCDFGFWLLDVKVFPVGLKPVRQNLNPQHPVGDAVKVALPFRTGLQFHPAACLLAFGGHRVQDDRGIPHRLAVVVLDDREIQPRGWLVVLVLLRENWDRICEYRKQYSRPTMNLFMR